MRRRVKQTFYPARGRGRSEPQSQQSPKKAGLLAVIVALAVTGGVIVGMKVGPGGSFNLAAGDDPSASASADPSESVSGSAEPSVSASASAEPSESAAPEPTEEPETGPKPEDFIDIRQVDTRLQNPRPGRNASTGSFISRCGTNENNHNNTDNFIVAPGVTNGAHHLHDYVGNLDADAFSTDESLAAAGTTCRLGDRSTYYWPVVRVPGDAVDDGTQEGNIGRVLRPTSVTLQFRGNARGNVVAMPRFLRVIMGNAKAATQDGLNARAAWGCTGTTRVTDKYPLCPRGSQVTRTLDFPSCWDGQNADSANHRDHIRFADAATGACPEGTQAVPQLRLRLTYSVPRGPSFALDTFPEQLHNPTTDHADFVNVMPERLMNFVVSCINRDRRC